VSLSEALVASNEQIAIVKERAAAGNIAALEDDLRKLRAIEARFRPDVAPLCDDYLAQKERKLVTERLRDEARQALDQYRNEEIPACENAINRYLGHFNAGYRLHQVTSVNTRAGSSCNYSVLIDNTPVPLSAAGEAEPSFRNTLSAGDRNALALAFFFASLERDPDRARKIFVIDDPMTSLDEHRALTTVQQMRQLLEDVEQVIVLSHSKPFLCGLWEGADTDIRSALKIVRSNPGSSFASWDVTQDCITEHDRRHRLVRDYLRLPTDPMSAPSRQRFAPSSKPISVSAIRSGFRPELCSGNFLASASNTKERPTKSSPAKTGSSFAGSSITLTVFTMIRIRLGKQR
jgi:wobble nucleotide-excising tRNase